MTTSHDEKRRRMLKMGGALGAAGAFGGGVALTFLFSTFAFRTLGKIGRMLDLVERGEFEPDTQLPEKKATDELSVMASKVSLLGQRLRGAEFEVHDLRGNIDHLLQDLEDAVFIFNRELRLVFASRDRKDARQLGEPVAAKRIVDQLAGK